MDNIIHVYPRQSQSQEWPNIDIDSGITMGDISFYNNPTTTDTQRHQYLSGKFSGIEFDAVDRCSGRKGTYIRYFHLNERIAGFILLDPAIPQPIFDLISRTFIQEVCHGSKDTSYIHSRARELNYGSITDIITKTPIPYEYGHTYRSFKYPNKPLTSLKKYKEKFIQIKYRLMNLNSIEGYDRSDHLARKCVHCKTHNNPEHYEPRQDDGKPPPRVHFCRCSPISPLPSFITSYPVSDQIKEIRWRIQAVGEAFILYKAELERKLNEEDNTARLRGEEPKKREPDRKNIINLNFVMCKILELMHLPELTEFWPMISSSERLYKIIEHWDGIIKVLREREVTQCRTCKGDASKHVYMWGNKYTDLCYFCDGRKFVQRKAIYYPWRSNDPDVYTTREYTREREWEYGVCFDRKRGYYPSDEICPGWYVVEESIQKKKDKKKIIDKISNREYFRVKVDDTDIVFDEIDDDVFFEDHNENHLLYHM